jgi:hypothetical protein
VEEKDVLGEEGWYFEHLAARCIQSLENRNIKGYYFQNRAETREYILNTISPEAIVGLGDSVTLHQIGIIEAMHERGQRIISPFWKEEGGKAIFPRTRKEAVNKGREALFSDFFLSGINAITLEGEIVNTDGLGNRLAGMIFGPRRVIMVAGVNKIVKDKKEAFERIKRVAAPLDARRHYMKHGMENVPPCTHTGECVDCRQSSRFCCFTLIIEYQTHPRIEVILVGEDMGL